MRGGDLAPVGLVDLGDQGQEGVAEDRSGAAEGLDQPVLGGERFVAGHDLGQALADHQDLRLDAPQPLGRHAPQDRVPHLLELVGQADLVLGELTARHDQLGHLLDQGIMARFAGRQLGREAGDHLRVDPVVLGQPAKRPGVLSKPVGVDQAHRQAGLAQRLGQAPLIAAAGLQADRPDPAALQPPDQFDPAGLVVADPERHARLQHRRVQPQLGHVDPDIPSRSTHLLTPILACGVLPPATVRAQEEGGRGLIHGMQAPGVTGSRPPPLIGS